MLEWYLQFFFSYLFLFLSFNSFLLSARFFHCLTSFHLKQLIDFSVLLVEWCVLYRLLGFLEHLVVVIVSLSSYPLCPLSTPLLTLAHMYIGLTMDPKLLTKCSLYFSIYFNFFLSQFKVYYFFVLLQFTNCISSYFQFRVKLYLLCYFVIIQVNN